MCQTKCKPNWYSSENHPNQSSLYPNQLIPYPNQLMLYPNRLISKNDHQKRPLAGRFVGLEVIMACEPYAS
jgi:hypothetical protein